MPEHTVSPHHACAGGAALTVIEGVAAPLPLPNLDTDQIMPKQFLRIIDKSGLDRGLFHDMRFDEHGAPRADFVLNQPRYRRQRAGGRLTSAAARAASTLCGACSRPASPP